MAETALQKFLAKVEEFEMTQFKSFDDLDTKWLGHKTGRYHVGKRTHYTYRLRNVDGGFNATTTLVIQHYMGGGGLVLQANVLTS